MLLQKREIPEIVISRLPVYLQKLNQVLKEGKTIISSQELADHLGVSATQIRKDLSNFGGFGKQGSGYNVVNLLESLQDILNLNRVWKTAVFGVGNLGRALLSYKGFASKGFEIVTAFDNDPELIGKEIEGITVKDIEDLEKCCCDSDVKIAILTVPATEAQELANRLVKCGFKAVLNYAPTTLMLPEEIKVSNIDPVLVLQKMAYYLV